MKRGKLFVALLVANFGILFSQKTLKVNLIDNTTGEALIGAMVINLENNKVYPTNTYGFALIPTSDKRDSLTLRVSYVGYADSTIRVAKSDSLVTIAMTPKPTQIEDVYVQGYNKIPHHGQLQLTASQLNQVPVIFAERDVLKSIQMLPGVQQNREGTSNFSVRGGNFDQNLILLDGIPVYNINHLFGFVSVISTDAVNHASFYKGAIPARYGNRLSSVLDISLREGNKDHLTGSFGAGILSAKITVEGPLRNHQGSFLIAARRTPYDLIVAPISTLFGNRIGYYYQDLVAKINFPLNNHNSLYLSTYYGADKAYRAEFSFIPQSLYKFRTAWGNITTALRWANNSLPNTLSNLIFAFTRYRYIKDTRAYDKAILGKQIESLSYTSNINDIIIRWNIAYAISPSHQINTGIDNNFHVFNPGTNYAKNQDTTSSFGQYFYHNETNAFIEDVVQWPRITTTVGVRATYYQLKSKAFYALQPRMLFSLKVSNKTTLSASYNRMYQFLHLYANSNIGLPTDLWVPVMQNLPPSSSNQYSAGFKSTLDKITFSSEVFFKDMQNVTDYRDGVILNNTQTNWDEVLSVGKGVAYGIEWLIDYHHPQFDVSLAYTYSRSFRKHKDIKQGQWFPYTYDRPHNININLQWKLNSNKQLIANWVYASGYMITVSEGNFYIAGRVFPDLSNRNNYRTPPMHHLDVTYAASKNKKRGTQTWSFGVYNIYARTNPFGYMYNITDLNNKSIENPRLQFVSLFTFVPFVAYEFKFK